MNATIKLLQRLIDEYKDTDSRILQEAEAAMAEVRAAADSEAGFVAEHEAVARCDRERRRALDILRSLRPDADMLKAVAMEGSSTTTYKEAFSDACAKAAAIIEHGASAYEPPAVEAGQAGGER